VRCEGLLCRRGEEQCTLARPVAAGSARRPWCGGVAAGQHSDQPLEHLQVIAPVRGLAEQPQQSNLAPVQHRLPQRHQQLIPLGGYRRRLRLWQCRGDCVGWVIQPDPLPLAGHREVKLKVVRAVLCSPTTGRQPPRRPRGSGRRLGAPARRRSRAHASPANNHNVSLPVSEHLVRIQVRVRPWGDAPDRVHDGAHRAVGSDRAGRDDPLIGSTGWVASRVAAVRRSGGGRCGWCSLAGLRLWTWIR
jgi:hypothetical protein